MPVIPALGCLKQEDYYELDLRKGSRGRGQKDSSEVKVFVTNPKGLSLVPVIHMLEGENPGLHAQEASILTHSPLTSTCALWCAHHATLQYKNV